jgi:Mannitol repressor
LARTTKVHPSLKQLIQAVPSEDETTRILGALSKGRLTHYSDRAVAVIGSTLLDNALKVAIQTRFINLKLADVAQIFDGLSGGPLSSLSAKVKIAFALGIVNETRRDDLNRIRAVRNTFAHSIVPISFRTHAVVQECKKLSMRSRKGGAKDRYIVTVAFLVGYLEGYASEFVERASPT